MAKYILATANGKYMSEIYTMNGLDFETLYEVDAKKFDTLEEANEFILESAFDTNFIWPQKIAEDEK